MKGKIFNIQEVEAIIAGKKTMFRELIKKSLAHFNNITKQEHKWEANPWVFVYGFEVIK